MSMALERFCLMVSFANPTAVELSTCMGVSGWGYLSLRSSVRMGTASCPLIYVAPILASAADPMALDMILVTV